MTIQGKQTPLPVTDPTDQGAAWDAFRDLVNKAIREGGNIRPGPVAAIIPDYLSSLAHRASKHTIQGYAVYLRRFDARFGNSAVAALDPDTVQADAAAEAWSDTNRANYLWTVQAMIRWAGRKDFTLRRPPRGSRGADAIISPEAHAAVLRETTGDFHEFCKALWQTGARPMELARLTAADVDWSTGTATLKKHKMQHRGKKRILYFSAEALAILRGQADRYGNAGHLFRGLGGKPLSMHAIVTRMIRISQKIKRPVTAYGYRHSWATRALAAGVPDTHVAAVLGHSSTAMVHKHYSHVAENARLLRDVVNRVA